MKLPLEILYRDMAPLPSADAEVRRRVAKFEQWNGEVIRCQVSLEAADNRHRTGHEYRARVTVRVAGGELVVSDHHRESDALLALRGAFDAMDRLLRERIEKLRDRRPEPPAGPPAAAVEEAEP